MNATAWIVFAFFGCVAGISLAAVSNALGVPARIALYSGEKAALRYFPWAMSIGGGIFAFVSITDGVISAPRWVAYPVLLIMGMFLGMSSMSLAEILDIFAGGMGYLRKREIFYAGVAIAIGKAVLSAAHIIFWGD